MPPRSPFGRHQTFWRAADAVMLALFAFGAIVQVNDPDPLPWVAIYAIAAAVCLISLRHRPDWKLAAAVAALALIWAALLSPRVVGRVPFGDMFGAFEMRDRGIEESREMYGLLLIALWMGVVAVRGRRRERRT